MRHLFIDIETYSSVDIAGCGLFKYALSPDFEVLLFAYSLDGAPVQIVDLAQGEVIPDVILDALGDPEVIKHAYNAAFEWFCLSQLLGVEEPGIWVEQWRCSMLHGQYAGYPAGLAALGKALGLPEDKQKMGVGKALIAYFCKPCKATKSNGGRSRNLPHHDPEKWELFKTYCKQDVVTEMENDKRLQSFEVPAEVQRQWELDQRINLRGVAVDMDMADGAIWLGDAVKAKLTDEAKQLTGLDNPNSVSQLVKWLQKETDEDVADLRKDTVSDMLGKELPNEAVRRVLEIRKELGKASVKKYNAIENCVCPDGRVRGLLAFYGANRTGREAGRLVQVQNLPHDVIPFTPLARDLVRGRQLDALQLLYGSITTPLSALIRTCLVAAPGHRFIDADFSAIEARVIAWLAGEEWVLDVFRTHGKIYEATASQMFNIPLERIKKGNPEYSYRAKGKVATLALGYQGGSGALVTMGALRSGLTEDELPDIVTRWRKSNPAIVNFWYYVEAAAQEAIVNGRRSVVGRVEIAREMDPANGQDFMTIKLPSGRKLYYVQPSIGTNRFGKPSICYHGQNQTTKKWGTLETYGGKLVENITQAVARDCLFYAMENLTRAGYPIVFDIHDEVILEVPEGFGSLADVVRIMSNPPPWAQDLPLNADGWEDTYFKKD